MSSLTRTSATVTAFWFDRVITGLIWSRVEVLLLSNPETTVKVLSSCFLESLVVSSVQWLMYSAFKGNRIAFYPVEFQHRCSRRHVVRHSKQVSIRISSTINCHA